ncbi:MAG: NifU family protein [Flavobacteriales bacterium]|nr:NifU family protein [Flavobacteriales bacterium]
MDDSIATPQHLQELAQKGLDDVRAVLLGDGGDIELSYVTPDGTEVGVALTGMCAGCMMSEITLGGIVKNSIKKYIPQLLRVVNTGDAPFIT